MKKELLNSMQRVFAWKMDISRIVRNSIRNRLYIAKNALTVIGRSTNPLPGFVSKSHKMYSRIVIRSITRSTVRDVRKGIIETKEEPVTYWPLKIAWSGMKGRA